MIVGTKDVDVYDVGRHCESILELRAYSDSLVPRILQHNQQIINNQRYIVALLVRNIKSIPYARRKFLYEELLEGVSISGLANRLYDFEDIMMSVDVDKLATFMNKGEDYERIRR